MEKDQVKIPLMENITTSTRQTKLCNYIELHRSPREKINEPEYTTAPACFTPFPSGFLRREKSKASRPCPNFPTAASEIAPSDLDIVSHATFLHLRTKRRHADSIIHTGI